MAAGDLIHHALHFVERDIQFVIKRRIVNELADRTLPLLDGRHNAVQPPHQYVHILQGGLAGADHILQIRLILGRQHITLFHPAAFGGGAVNIHKGLAQHTGGA